MNPALRTALVVAHPDDEAIGAACLLLRARDLYVLHVTDGAPRDGNDARAHGFATIEQYAAARQAEAQTVLDLAGLPPARWIRLAYPDCGVCDALDQVASDLARWFADARIEQIVTHPYEGGHPDHDAVACAVHRAASVPVYEMTSYHAGPSGELVSGRFLNDESPVIALVLDRREQALKRAMLQSYATQARTLAQFPAGATELYRPAPHYDFTRPPASRLLFYESCT
jgi:N-acetylglucosamine malate deacetylase 2